MSNTYDKSYTVAMAGNAHIDTAWQWTTNTTITSYIPHTYTNAVNLMNANPDYTFNGSASLHFKWIKQYYPDLYEKVKAKVANGQLCIVGGQFVEPDLNLPSGESLIRQSLFGQRFFQQEFGRKCTVGWVPDSFGFNGQMPQILKKSGMDYFVTTKLNWNDTNKFPYELFNWTGIDGSQVITDKPREDYTASVEDSKNITSTLDQPNGMGIKKGLVLYGQGDGGGGPTQTDINTIRSDDNNDAFPGVKMNTGSQFFNSLTAADQQSIKDIWRGEMYLEFHRGTYTSQGLIKKNNRFGEIAAEEAEKLSSIANFVGCLGYPQADINFAWEKILKNQFHDVLPGSGTADQVQEAWVDGQTAIDTLSGVIQEAMAAIAAQADTSGAGIPFVVFNPLSFDSLQPVQTTLTFEAAPASVRIYDDGTEIPSQVLNISGNSATIVCMATLPSIGFKVLHAIANTGNYSGDTGLSLGANRMESDLFRLEINPLTGNISSIYDKANAREVLAGGEGNVLQILSDNPKEYDAWNVDYEDMTATPLALLNTPSSIGIVEQGPVKCTYRIAKSYGSSTFSQYITLYPGIERIDIRMTADWHEAHKMLKVAFPWNVGGAAFASYETAYGAVTRSNQRDTAFNKARFEVPAHRWADLSNNGYGVSLLNNCKYGYDTYLNTMRLSLLRAPKSPDPNCDMGAHEFTYSIYPHSGNWNAANISNTVYKAYELNYPNLSCQTTSHDGNLGKTYSFIQVNQPNVILSVVKKAEDSGDFMIRMYESLGIAGTNATITLPGTISTIAETTLLEETISTPSYNGGTFSVTLGAYDIRSFKVSFAQQVPTSRRSRCTGGTVTADGDNPPNEDKTKAFDGNYSTKWLTFKPAGWIQYQFPGTTAYAIHRYAITSANDYPGRDPKNWTLQASNDGYAWTVLDNRTNITFPNRFQKLTFTMKNTTPYKIYRLNITANAGEPDLQLGELELYDD
jgi:alpha-mannosidase